MKKRRRRIRKGRVAFVLIMALLVLDLGSVIIFKRPMLAYKSEEAGVKTIYHGLLFNGYDCQICDNKRPVLKFSNYECPVERHEKRAKLTLVGDLLFEGPYYDDIEAGTKKDLYFNKVKDYFENDDLTIANMEVAIDDGTMEISGDGYSFCAPRWVGELVASYDFELLGTANNHAYDRDTKGIDATLDFFKNHSDIMTVGTYKDQKDRATSRILTINDIKFGFLAYTYATNTDPEVGDEYRVGYYKDPHTYEITQETKAIMQSEISKLRNECDVLVVMMHWGQEFTFEPDEAQLEMADFLNSLGVDLIVGSHSHNIQPIDMIGDKHQTLVYYSLGNFVSADEDLDRTDDDETFDNAYQVGMLGNLEVVVNQKEVRFENIDTNLIVNYFDKDARNFELVPLDKYDQTYEKSHQRYSLGLAKDAITEMFNSVVDAKYR